MVHFLILPLSPSQHITSTLHSTTHNSQFNYILRGYIFGWQRVSSLLFTLPRTQLGRVICLSACPWLAVAWATVCRCFVYAPIYHQLSPPTLRFWERGHLLLGTTVEMLACTAALAPSACFPSSASTRNRTRTRWTLTRPQPTELNARRLQTRRVGCLGDPFMRPLPLSPPTSTQQTSTARHALCCVVSLLKEPGFWERGLLLYLVHLTYLVETDARLYSCTCRLSSHRSFIVAAH